MIFVEETRSARWRLLLLGFTGISLLYLIVFLLPMLYMATVSVGGGSLGGSPHLAHWWSDYSEFWGSSYYRGILYSTLKLGVTTVLVTMAISLPLAYLAAKGSRLYRTITLVALLNPLFVSTIVRAFGLNVILQKVGIQQSFTAVLIGFVQVLLPFMAIPLMSGMRDIDPLLVHSARTLGAGRLRTAYRIVLPVLAPSMLAGSTLVFILTLNVFSIPLLMGRPEQPTMGLLVYQSAITNADFTFAATLAVSLLAITLVVIWFQGRLVRVVARSSTL